MDANESAAADHGNEPLTQVTEIWNLGIRTMNLASSIDLPRRRSLLAVSSSPLEKWGSAARKPVEDPDDGRRRR